MTKALLSGLILLLVFPVLAGQVVVHTDSQPFDAFALRNELAKQHQWQESLRAEQQLEIINKLPLGCISVNTPYHHFSCGQRSYRPYDYQGKSLYIGISPPQVQPQPKVKGE